MDSARYRTPFGDGFLTYDGDRLQSVILPGGSRPGPVVSRPPAAVAAVAGALEAYFAGEGPWPGPAELADRAGATPFAQAVYRAVAAIPPGRTLTYGEVAARIGRSGAARAVGRAMATNPFPVLIPCHRVVASGGSLGGYAGGLGLKRAMLDLEAGRG